MANWRLITQCAAAARNSSGASFLHGQGLVLLLIVGAAALRMLPHPENIAPIGALALFSGAYLQRRVFWLVPLGALLLGDLHNGLYQAAVMLAVYLGFLASTAVGRGLLHGRDSVGRVALAVGAGALVFWLISNAGNWLAFHPQTAAALLQCYMDGLPYLGRSLAGDAVYAVLLFGGYRLARQMPLLRMAPAH